MTGAPEKDLAAWAFERGTEPCFASAVRLMLWAMRHAHNPNRESLTMRAGAHQDHPNTRPITACQQDMGVCEEGSAGNDVSHRENA